MSLNPSKRLGLAALLVCLPLVLASASALVATNTMTFAPRNVVAGPLGLASMGVAQDLYEPNIDVGRDASGAEAIYITGHVIGALTTGTPAYFSTDNGATWSQLPIASIVSSPVQGAAPPVGDEGHIMADATGRAWMVDMSGAQMYAQGWCGNGASECFYQPDAWNNVAAALPCQGLNIGSAGTDRPWGAYANNKLLLVNNGFARLNTNIVQVGFIDVTPGLPVGVLPPTWNGCAGSGGYIPGVPSLRSDGVFVVPQRNSAGTLKLVTGTLPSVAVAETTTGVGGPDWLGGCGYAGANWGVSTVSAAGTFYAAIGNGFGFSVVATPTPGVAASVKSATFTPVGSGIQHLWIAGSKLGEGAEVSWIEAAGGCATGNVYSGHVTLSGGVPTISDVSLVAPGVPSPCGDLMGSALSGVTGDAYVAVFSDPNGCLDTPGSHPLTTYVQTAGPTI